MKHVRSRKHAVAQAEYLARLEHLARETGASVARSAVNQQYYRGATPTQALAAIVNTRRQS